MKLLNSLLATICVLWLVSGIWFAWNAYHNRQAYLDSFCTLDTVLVRILEPGAKHADIRQDIASIQDISPCIIKLRGHP